jgi:hypothetical protein
MKMHPTFKIQFNTLSPVSSLSTIQGNEIAGDQADINGYKAYSYIPDAGIGVPDASIAVPDISIGVPDASIAVPDISIGVPDASIAVPDIRIAAPDISILIPDISIAGYIISIIISPRLFPLTRGQIKNYNNGVIK